MGDAAVEWLLRSEEPAVRELARRDLVDGREVDTDAVLRGPIVQALLAGQQPDGGFGVHPYGKWTGADWRLVSLVELGIPPGDPRAVAAAGTVLDWLTGKNHRRSVRVIDGLARRCASQEGNALAVCARLGLASDERVRLLAESLLEWQWPDGGWNCDVRATGLRSSFHESLPPAWGLHEYWVATGDQRVCDVARRTAGLLLDHHLFQAHGTTEVIHPSFVTLHYPPYWHYDVLQASLVLARMGMVEDPRTADALDLLESKRRTDGRWQAGGRWWKRPGSRPSNVEVVDWGGRGPNEMITLNALRVLRAAGRA